MTGYPTSADTVAKTGPQLVAFKPAINAMVDVLTPQGLPRIYATSSGSTLWSPGSSLVIYRGDKIKLQVFVSTGAYELQHVKVRLDNVPIVSIDHQPWSTVCDTGTLDTGYHMFQIWAQSDSPSPYSSSEQNIAFYLAQPSQEAGSGVDVTTPGPTTGGGVPEPTPSATAVPGPSADAMTAGASKPSLPISVPANPVRSITLPNVLSGDAQTPSAIITLQTGSATPVVGQNTVPVALNGPTDVVVGVPKGSTARRFTYALYRDGAIIYQSDRLLPAFGTQIRLQARTDSQPGLLPGDVTLRAWGVDQNNSYGPDTSMAVTIPVDNSGEAVR
jgi:hypothetical protein